MKLTSQASMDDVCIAWLQAELYRHRSVLSPAELQLIESPDTHNPTENAARASLLTGVFKRQSLMKRLPSDIKWHRGEIEESDTEHLFMMPVWDWFLDSGRTFRLKDVPASVADSREARRPKNSYTLAAQHGKVIKEMLNSPNKLAEGLVILSSGFGGPFSIIEGTHRSVALLIKKQLTGWPCFLGISAAMANCPWSIERSDLQIQIAGLQQLEAQGLLR